MKDIIKRKNQDTYMTVNGSVLRSVIKVMEENELNYTVVCEFDDGSYLVRINRKGRKFKGFRDFVYSMYVFRKDNRVQFCKAI